VSDDAQSSVAIYAKANLANIVKKLKAGKTLSGSERKALDEYEAQQAGTEWAKDVSALARELGYSRQTIYEARNRFPNEAPAKHPDGKKENLDAWRKFCAEKLIGKDVSTKTLADLKAELMREQIELARAKNRREAGEMVEREVVRSMLRLLSQKLDLLLRLKLEVELGPRIVGKSAAEANVEGSLILDEIREVIAGNIARFETEAVKATFEQEDAE
jgi:hypothetical protein